MKIIFFGTSEVAVPFFTALLQESDVEIIGCVTRPDQRVASPIASVGAAANVPVHKYATVKNPDIVAELASLHADVFVVVSYGNILPQTVLDLAPTINVHFSLLPRHRGACPVQETILLGDPVGGITIMLMDARMDHGPILAQESFPLPDHVDTPTLFFMSIERGVPLFLKTLHAFMNGALVPIVQDESKATYTNVLTREDGKMEWQKDALSLDRQVRAYRPWPGTWTTWNGKRLKILRARPSFFPISENPGTIVKKDNGCFVVCKKGALELLEVQLEGARPLAIQPFLLGQSTFIGSILGTSGSLNPSFWRNDRKRNRHLKN